MLPIAVDVIAKRAATLGDGVGQRIPDRLDQAREPGPRNAVGGARRADSRAKQRLVGVDIAHTDDEPIVHQRELDRRAPVARSAIEIVGVERVVERLRSEGSEQRVLAFRGGRPQHRAEAARIAIAQHDSVRELEIDVIVRLLRRRLPEHSQASRHAEVNDERVLTEPEEQVLAPPLDAIDRAADKAARQVAGNRPA